MTVGGKLSQTYRTMKLFRVIAIFLLILASSAGFTQEGDNPIFRKAKVAIKKGNAKQLIGHFNNTVSLNFDGETDIYGKAQSEFVLKEFFEKHPVLEFEYNHLGQSPEGLQYAIGKYTYSGGAFLVYIMIKESNGEFIIDTLNFHEEGD